MPKRKEAEKFAATGSKDCWHSYSLQALSTSRFAQVVGNILKGQYVLINSRMQDRAAV
ncbi:MAG: hypothetical protein AB1644_01755 [Candidatus Zixiibacteriota bacterium]